MNLLPPFSGVKGESNNTYPGRSRQQAKHILKQYVPSKYQ
jgi:hypothetical protein